MRILFFINSLVGGGAERVTVLLANQFVEMGHNVAIFVKEDIIAYPIDQRVEISVSEPCKLKGKITRLIAPFASYYKRYVDTKKFVKNYQPDIIVASWGCNLLQVLLASNKVPVVASEHNTFDRKHSVREYINRFWLNRFCNKVVMLTRYDKVYMSRILRNAVVIPNPLTFSPITKDVYETQFQNRRNILACGRLNAYHVKGFDNLLYCFAQIAQKHPEWDLDLAGNSDEKSKSYLSSLCKSYNIEKRVHFLGFSNNVAELMSKHSIYVLTSRSEGFGMVLTEAMAMGCPCISYDLSGPSEIIVNNVDGILVESQNKDLLVKVLENLINDAELRRDLGGRAIQNVQRFFIHDIAKMWIHLFENLK